VGAAGVVAVVAAAAAVAVGASFLRGTLVSSSSISDDAAPELDPDVVREAPPPHPAPA